MDPLDVLGRFLVVEVRDEAVERWQRIFDGRLKGVDAEAVRKRLGQQPSKEVVEFAQWLVPQVVEGTLQKLLVALEQSDEVTVSVEADGVVTPDIKEVSDGLAGELWSEEGWIARFKRI